MIWWPVFMKICAGAWLNCVVCIERTMAMSSAMLAEMRQQRPRSRAPDCPCLPNVNGEPSSRGVPLMNAKRSPLTNLFRDRPGRRTGAASAFVEEIELRRRAGHEQVDHLLGLRREVRAREAAGGGPPRRPPDSRSSISDASAREPMPKPVCRKK